MNLPATYLFVPGNRPDRFDKALASAADALILDLEDAVSPAEKDLARREISQWLAAKQPAVDRIVVRINDCSSPWFDPDLELVHSCAIRFAMLPKAESPEQIAAVAAALPADGFVLPLIETARGVNNVDAVAQAPGVQRLAFGTLDYGVDLDLSGDERGLMYPSARIALASRCAELASPIAGVTATIDDDAKVMSDFVFARAFGFGAKLCIHPKQIAVIRKALAPTLAELDWARRVLAAAAEAHGAVQVDGKMVDRPVLLKAQGILDRSAN
jgi:citrate lyase subunit beta/citryl-CoA lyase